MLSVSYHRKSFDLSFLQSVVINLPFTHSVNISGPASPCSDLLLLLFLYMFRSLSVGELSGANEMLSMLVDKSKTV